MNKYTTQKRLLDFISAIALLFVCLPVFALVAFLIWLEDKGPALYTQTRAGRLHEPFTMYKFRSMRVGTKEMTTEDMQRQGIQPYTRIGRFLRRSSLDELPQLWNIAKGEMSFVGPRPALMTQTPVLTGRKQMGADQLLPGLTGLAQVKGRDDLDDQTKVKLDAEYLQAFGFQQDWAILVATFKAVFHNTGNK